MRNAKCCLAPGMAPVVGDQAIDPFPGRKEGQNQGLFQRQDMVGARHGAPYFEAGPLGTKHEIVTDTKAALAE